MVMVSPEILQLLIKIFLILPVCQVQGQGVTQQDLYMVQEMPDKTQSSLAWTDITLEDIKECGVACSVSQHCNTFTFNNNICSLTKVGPASFYGHSGAENGKLQQLGLVHWNRTSQVNKQSKRPVIIILNTLDTSCIGI